MPQTPTQRPLRSNSNPNTAITLSDIKSLIEKSNKEILSTLTCQIEKQTEMISSLVKQVDVLNERNQRLEERCNKLEDDLMKTKTSLLDDLSDQYRRRRNLIISGVPEPSGGSADERKHSDVGKVTDIFEAISVNDNVSVVHVHRIGRIMEGRNRLLRVVLRDEDSKYLVLKEARQLRNTPSFQKVFVNPDLTQTQRREGKRLREELKRRKDAGEDVILRRNRIVSRSSASNFQ